MKLTDIFTITHLKSSKSERYIAKFGQIGPEAFGETKDIALSRLVADIEQQEHKLYTRGYRWSADGSMWILSYQHGWTYSRIAPGMGYPSGTTVLACRTYPEALDLMTDHVHQYNAGLPLKESK